MIMVVKMYNSIAGKNKTRVCWIMKDVFKIMFKTVTASFIPDVFQWAFHAYGPVPNQVVHNDNRILCKIRLRA